MTTREQWNTPMIAEEAACSARLNPDTYLDPATYIDLAMPSASKRSRITRAKCKEKTAAKTQNAEVL